MRARSALLLVLLLGVASPAAAVSILGHVEQDRVGPFPGMLVPIRPGEVFTVVVFLNPETQITEVSLFEGRFAITGVVIQDVDPLFGIEDLHAFTNVVGNKLLTSFTFTNTRLPVNLFRLHLLKEPGLDLGIEILGDESPLFAQRDTPTGVADVLRITERASLPLVCSDPCVVPEPMTIILVMLGLAGLEFGRRRLDA